MAIRLRNLSLEVDEPESRLLEIAASALGLATEAVARWQIARRSLDARRRRVRFVYSIDVVLTDPAAEDAPVRRGLAVALKPRQARSYRPGSEEVRGRVVVVGCGPAGLFAALELAANGYRPLLIERGAPVDERCRDVAAFLGKRELSPESNLLFGAGGAGTYSDGKLRTRINDPLTREILNLFVSAGAPEDTLVNARPHIGTDRLHVVVPNLCKKLVALGGEISWRTKLIGLDAHEGLLRRAVTSRHTLETNCLILATGANARDTFGSALECGVAMEPKPFQMGLRVEHPRELTDRGVYGDLAGHPRLGAAEYVLSAGEVTSFCVCPGGALVAASVESESVCTNGMCNHARDSDFTNAALVTTVRPEEFGTDALSGLAFQRHYEREAFSIGGKDYTAPAQTVADFLSGRVTPLSRAATYPLGIRPASMEKVLPGSVASAIASALPQFESRIPGFTGEAGILVGPETRASCAVRVLRNPEQRGSISIDGVYPAGEGSGYSSGIMSSAVDGIHSAGAVITRFAVPRG